MPLTPQEFADAHGLSLDEAEVILARRARASSPTKLSASTEKLKRALDALEAAQKKVGVHPVAVRDGELEKGFDESAEDNLTTFYAKKLASGDYRPKRRLNAPVVAVEDVSQDPEDY